MYIMQKLWKFYYSNVSSYFINYSAYSPDVYSDSLSHSESEAPSLFSSCSQSAALDKKIFKTIFWSYCPTLLSKVLKSIPLLLMLMLFLFCHSMSKHDCLHSAKHYNAYGYDLWMACYVPPTVSVKPVAQMKYNVANCITSVPLSIVTIVTVRVIITITIIIITVNMQYKMCHWSPFHL